MENSFWTHCLAAFISKVDSCIKLASICAPHVQEPMLRNGRRCHSAQWPLPMTIAQCQRPMTIAQCQAMVELIAGYAALSSSSIINGLRRQCGKPRLSRPFVLNQRPLAEERCPLSMDMDIIQIHRWTTPNYRDGHDPCIHFVLFLLLDSNF